MKLSYKNSKLHKSRVHLGESGAKMREKVQINLKNRLWENY